MTNNKEKIKLLDKKLGREIALLGVLLLLIITELTLMIAMLVPIALFSVGFLLGFCLLFYKKYQSIRLTARELVIYEAMQDE